MSAIGSVIVMVTWSTFLAAVPQPGSEPALRPAGRGRAYSEVMRLEKPAAEPDLPAGLVHTGQLAPVRHLAEADPAQAELAEHRVRATSTLAAGVTPHLELRLGRGLVDQRLLGHDQFSLNGKPRSFSSARPSSSLVAVVTTVMSIPRGRSMASGSISWNIDCSLRPNV